MALAQYLGVNKPLADYNSNNNAIYKASIASPVSSALGNNNNGMTGIRNYLTGQGYNNNDIGYNNGYVTLKGNNFMQATPQAQDDLAHGMYQGSTYASPTALQSALGAYQNTYGTPSSDLTSMSGRQSAISGALNNEINQANQQPFQFKQQQAPFSYDPNSDQAYQAALRAAQFNIQQGQGNTLGQLSAHGMGNSSYAATAAQQIANQGMQNVSQNILPQLIQQAYQRYQDQNNNDYRNQQASYGVSQDQFRNQSAIANQLQGLNQQDTQNQLASAGLTGQLNGQQTMAGEQNQAALTGMLPNGQKTYAAQQQDISNAINRANTLGYVSKEDAALLGVPEGTVTKAMQVALNDMAYKNSELGLRQDANNIAAQRAGNMASHYGAMDNYYNARADQANNPQGNATQQKNNLESTYVSNIEQMTPENRSSFFKNEKSSIIKDLGVSGYNQLYNTYFDQYGDPK